MTRITSSPSPGVPTVVGGTTKLEHSFADVVIVGGGVAGLCTACALAELGMRVLLVEKKDRLAPNSSSKNEGWWHAGTQHGYGIDDPEEAVRVAKRCLYGTKWLMGMVPFAVEEVDQPAFALLNDEDGAERAESRWTAAGVPFVRSKPSALRALAPTLRTWPGPVYRVEDRTIDNTVLFRWLGTRIRALGGTIMTASDIQFLGAESAVISNTDGDFLVRPNCFVHAAGISTGDLLKKLFDFDLGVRTWQSHLLMTKRLFPPTVLVLDTGGATVVHHDRVSLTGVNGEASQVSPFTGEELPGARDALTSALTNLVGSPHLGRFEVVACAKADRGGDGKRRSVEAVWGEVDATNHFYLLPGKMTEAPFAAHGLAGELHRRYRDEEVSLRPCDKFSEDEQLAAS